MSNTANIGTPLPGRVDQTLEPLRVKWGWIVALGVVFLIAGLVALGSVVMATVASVAVVGAMMLVSGIAEIVNAFGVKTWGKFFLWALLGALYVVAGLVTFQNPLLAATVLTLYPEMFPGPLGVSLARRALEEGAWLLDTVQIRDFATDKHRSVDDTPAGGGAGMALKADVLAAALDSVAAKDPKPRPMLALTPRGKPLTQSRVRELVAGEGVILLCGRFEGLGAGEMLGM